MSAEPQLRVRRPLYRDHPGDTVVKPWKICMRVFLDRRVQEVGQEQLKRAQKEYLQRLLWKLRIPNHVLRRRPLESG